MVYYCKTYPTEFLPFISPPSVCIQQQHNCFYPRLPIVSKHFYIQFILFESNTLLNLIFCNISMLSIYLLGVFESHVIGVSSYPSEPKNPIENSVFLSCSRLLNNPNNTSTKKVSVLFPILSTFPVKFIDFLSKQTRRNTSTHHLLKYQVNPSTHFHAYL